jgi:uncharacterized protein YkwD
MGWLKKLLNSIFKPKPTPPAPDPKPEPTPTPVPPPTTDRAALRLQLLKLHNNYRVSSNRGALIVDSRLEACAQAQIDYCARLGRLTHDQPKAVGPRIRDQGYAFATAGENIAAGQSTSSKVMQAWLNSSGHRSNIENKRFTQVGFGIAIIGTVHWWAAVFATPVGSERFVHLALVGEPDVSTPEGLDHRDSMG